MNLPGQIRNSLAAGDFQGAARQFEEHVRNLCAAIRERTCDAAAIEEARGLVLMARGERACLVERLRRLHAQAYVTSAYLTRRG